MKRKWINLAAVLGIALATWQPYGASAKDDTTRGLGVYPGRPTEYFGPDWECIRVVLPSISAHK